MANKVGRPNEQFLNVIFTEDEILRILNPELYFADVFPEVQTQSKAVIYKKDEYSDSTDPKKETPATRTAGSKFKYVEITNLTTKSALLEQIGFAIKIDEDARRYTEGIDEIKRAYNRVAFWMAEDINSTITSAIEDNANAPTTKFGTPTNWSEDAASPVKDLLHVAQDVKQEGYQYRATDVYLHTDNYWELLEYLMFIDAKWQQSPIGGAAVLTVPQLGNLNVHECLSGITEGDVIALDANNPAGTVYYATDPAYSTANVANTRLQVHKYIDDETHDVVIQIWKDLGVAIKEPKAAFYKSSGI